MVVTASDEELVSKLLAARSAILESDGEAQVDPAEVADLTPEGIECRCKSCMLISSLAVELMNSTRRLSVIETKLEALVNSEEDLLKTALTSQRQRLAKEYADALQVFTMPFVALTIIYSVSKTLDLLNCRESAIPCALKCWLSTKLISRR